MPFPRNHPLFTRRMTRLPEGRVIHTDIRVLDRNQTRIATPRYGTKPVPPDAAKTKPSL